MCQKLKVKPINAADFIARWDEQIRGDGQGGQNVKFNAGDEELLGFTHKERAQNADMNFDDEYREKWLEENHQFMV